MVKKMFGARIDNKLILKFNQICKKKRSKKQDVIENLVKFYIDEEDGED